MRCQWIEVRDGWESFNWRPKIALYTSPAAVLQVLPLASSFPVSIELNYRLVGQYCLF